LEWGRLGGAMDWLDGQAVGPSSNEPPGGWWKGGVAPWYIVMAENKPKLD